MLVVSNAGPIIALVKAGYLELLRDYFGEVYLSPATYHELTEKGKDKPGAKSIASSSWLKVKQLQDSMATKVLRLELDAGEAETIILAKEVNADLVLLDESLARNIATLLGLRVKGSIGLLVLAKKDGRIKNLQAILDKLRHQGVWISDELYGEALRLAEEHD